MTDSKLCEALERIAAYPAKPSEVVFQMKQIAREALATPPVVEGDWVALPSPYDLDGWDIFERERALHCFACGGALGTLTCNCTGASLSRQALISALEWSRRDALAAAPSAPVVGEGIPLVFYDASDPARRVATLADGLERMQGKIVISGWRMLIADLNRALATPPQSPPEPVAVGREAIAGVRRREVQMLGAGLSKRSWQEVEDAYNQLRDKVDAILALNPTGAK